MSITRHEVRYLDRIRMTLPSNPATRELGLASQPCEVTIGKFHARLNLESGIVRRIKLHEAGIVGDPTTGNLYIADPGQPQPVPYEPAPVLMRTVQLVEALDGCPRHASVVIGRVDRGRQTPHGIGQVAQRHSLVLTRGTELLFHKQAGSISPTSATMRVSELSTFAANGDLGCPVVLLTGSPNTVHGIHQVALSSSRVVWLLAGRPIKTPGRLVSRLMAGLQN